MIIYKQIFARGDKMIYKYNKLVRDKIPSEINAQPGRKCSYFIMNDEDYDKALDDKLTEELNEYKEDHSIEELADLMEVVTAIMKFRKISIDELKSTMDKKRAKKGGFNDKIYLKEIEELENKKEEQHLKNKQLQLLENLNKNSSLNEVQSYFKEMIKLRSFMNNKENMLEDCSPLSPEHSIIRSVLSKNGLFDGEDNIGALNTLPTGEIAGRYVSNEIGKYIRKCMKGQTSIEELYDVLKRTPYGERL